VTEKRENICKCEWHMYNPEENVADSLATMIIQKKVCKCGKFVGYMDSGEGIWKYGQLAASDM